MTEKQKNNGTIIALIIMVAIILMGVLSGCKSEDEIGEPIITMELDGVSIDVYERYKVVNFYGGQRIVDGKRKKGIAVYLQISEDRPSLSSQHFAALILNSDGKDNGEIIDLGL